MLLYSESTATSNTTESAQVRGLTK